MAGKQAQESQPPLTMIKGRQLLAILGFGGIALAALLALYIALGNAGYLFGKDPAHLDLSFGFLAYVIFLVTAFTVVRRTAATPFHELGLRRCDPALLWNAGFLALLWVGISSAIYAAAGIWEIALAEGANMIAPFRTDTATLIGLFVLAGPVAAIVEEIIFRGLLYGWLRQRLGIAVSAIVSALIFTGAHFYIFIAGLAAALEMTVLAVLLALLYELSRSLWPSIFCHALNNLLLLSLYLYQS